MIRFLLLTALLLAIFAVGSLVAWAAGAPNLGTALGFGQLAFAVALPFAILGVPRLRR